jgi:hypothetical protein
MPVTEKSCGECSLCCKTMQIPVLNKPKDVMCANCNPGRGCGIYETRPEVCRGFQCRWLLDPAMGPEWKPSRSGLVLVMDAHGRTGIHVDPDRPGAWRQEPYITALRALAAMGLAKGKLLLVMENSLTTVLLPRQEIPVGHVSPQAHIRVSERSTPAGPVFEAEVLPP